MVKGSGQVLPGQIHKMGIYLVVMIKPGLVIMWDKKTSLFIKLDPRFQVNNFLHVLKDNMLLHKANCLAKFIHSGLLS